jgi:hypothetical protein
MWSKLKFLAVLSSVSKRTLVFYVPDPDTSESYKISIKQAHTWKVHVLFGLKAFPMTGPIDQIYIKTPNPKCQLFLKTDQ